jgi:hypothetical protein
MMAAARPNETVDQGTLPAILHSALRQSLEMSPVRRTAILQRVRSIKTREQARQYSAEVQKKIRQRRTAAQLFANYLQHESLVGVPDGI